MNWISKPKWIGSIAFLAGIGAALFGQWLYQHRVNMETSSIAQAIAPASSHPNRPQTWFGQPLQKKSVDAADEDAAADSTQAILKHFQEEQARMDKMFRNFFQDDIPGHGADPFSQMRRLGANTGATEISTREDDKFLYYEIHSKNLDKNSLNVKIEQGMIAITGEIKQENENAGSGFRGKSVMVSRFQQSFPVPENVDADKMQVDSAPDKVVLKFPKKSA